MNRVYTREIKEAAYRLFHDIDNREWMPFMEWCGARAADFGEWPDRLGIVSCMGQADQYQMAILSINESLRKQMDEVFENVAGTDEKYAQIFRGYAAEVGAQIAQIEELTTLMSAGAAAGADFDKTMKSYKAKKAALNPEPVKDYADLDRYVNEETFRIMGWDVKVFKETYKGDAQGDAIEALKKYMYEYGITDKYSICMFLSTLGAESGDGSMKKEGIKSDGYDKCSYMENTRGAGLMQVTGWDQKEFLIYIREKIAADPSGKDNELLKEIDVLIAGYPESPSKKIIGGKEVEYCENSMNVTDFIAEHYPIESAAWYWGKYEKCAYYRDLDNEKDVVKMSINEYVCTITGKIDMGACMQHNNALGNVFLATQYYVNSSPWTLSRLQKIAECTDDTTYHIGTNLTFTMPEGDKYAGYHYGKLPNSWEEREEDMQVLDPELFG